MSSTKRSITLFTYNFSSKKIRNGAEAEVLTSNSNAPTTADSTITTNDDSNSLLLNDSQELDNVTNENEDNDEGEGIELKVIDSLPNTNKSDIGYYLFNKLPIDDNLKYSLITNHFKPNRKYSFPTLYSNDRKLWRRFLVNWLNDNSFLVYSPYIEGGYCINCVLLHNVQGHKLELFVDKPCHKYKHLKHFTTSWKSHINSLFHQNSTIAADNFIRTYKDPSLSISSLIDKNRFERINRNKTILLSIIKIIITCARQNIPIRGHTGETVNDIRNTISDIDSQSGSNFIALLKQRIDAGDELLRDHIQLGPKNASYTSSLVQN